MRYVVRCVAIWCSDGVWRGPLARAVSAVGELAPVLEDGIGEERFGEEQQVARLERAVDNRRVMQLLEALADLHLGAQRQRKPATLAHTDSRTLTLPLTSERRVRLQSVRSSPGPKLHVPGGPGSKLWHEKAAL